MALEEAWLFLKAGAPPPAWTKPANQSTQGMWGDRSLYGNQQEDGMLTADNSVSQRQTTGYQPGAGQWDKGAASNNMGLGRNAVQIETNPGLDNMADNVAAERHEASGAQAGGALEAMEEEPGFLANLTAGGRQKIKDWKDKKAGLEHSRMTHNDRVKWLRDKRPEGVGYEWEKLRDTSRGMAERGLTANDEGSGRVGREWDRRARRKIEVMPREPEPVWNNPEPTFREDHPTQAELWEKEKQKYRVGQQVL